MPDAHPDRSNFFLPPVMVHPDADAVGPPLRLHAEIGKILRMPDIAAKLVGQALEPSLASTEEFNQRIRSDYEKYGKLIRTSGAKVE